MATKYTAPEDFWPAQIPARTTVTSVRQIDQKLREATYTMLISPVDRYFTQVAEETGEYVKLDDRCVRLPYLRGRGERPVFLYEFVETLDGLIRYEEVQSELPQLYFGEIAGAMAYLRRICQFNVAGLDIDQVEEEIYGDEESTLALLEKSLANREIVRVLNNR